MAPSTRHWGLTKFGAIFISEHRDGLVKGLWRYAGDLSGILQVGAQLAAPRLRSVPVPTPHRCEAQSEAGHGMPVTQEQTAQLGDPRRPQAHRSATGLASVGSPATMVMEVILPASSVRMSMTRSEMRRPVGGSSPAAVRSGPVWRPTS